MDPGLREVSRHAVRSQVARTAEQLAAAQGFDETTVDQIAAATGMSQRTFFRYFASKEDVVLFGYAELNDAVLERLASRPVEETVWSSLRRALDVVVEEHLDPDRRRRGALRYEIVQASSAVTARYLGLLDGVQRQLTDLVLQRAPDHDPVVVRAMVGSAFACLMAAAEDAHHRDAPESLGEVLDRAMVAVAQASVAPRTRSAPMTASGGTH